MIPGGSALSFTDYPDFKITSDLSRVRRPDGGKKRRSKLKAKRSPMYVPASTDAQAERIRWLKR